MTSQHVSPDGLWRWDGTQWVANARPPVPAPPKRSSTAKVVAIVVGVLALLFAVVAAVDADKDADTAATVTVHEQAVAYATRCYDGTPSSNGIKMPGTPAFDSCVFSIASEMGSYFRGKGIEIVDYARHPVEYEGFAVEVSSDVHEWMTPDWTPTPDWT